MNADIIKIKNAVLQVVESYLYRIGSRIEGKARRIVIAKNIKDKDDFYQALGYRVLPIKDGLTLRVGSNVKHEQYVLGGKVPSWTPIEPLLAWVERKNLKWYDSKTNKELKALQIAYMIRGKIKREGIKARNIFAEILESEEAYIINQFNSIEVQL